MHFDILEELRDLGFRKAGKYTAAGFVIDRHWRVHEVVYVWLRQSQPVERLRVGIACGSMGFGRRYDHYNRWLAGRFKADNAREQKVRTLFLSRLDEACEVWARAVTDKNRALAEEAELRARWGAGLHLDLMAPGSWAKLEMQAWRYAGRPSDPTPAAVSAIKQVRVRSAGLPASATVTTTGPTVTALVSTLDAALQALGLAASPVKGGISYKLGAATICRVDPKGEFIRVQVGEAAELAAPAELRGTYQQRGWLIVRPEHAEIATAYVEQCVEHRLAG